jgi:hypothetical protein
MIDIGARDVHIPSQEKAKFSSQANPLLLDDLRALAAQEGRQFQALVEEAFADYIAKKRGQKPRPDVMDAFAASLSEFDTLYRDLAK